MGAVTITRTADPAGVNSVTTTTTYSGVAIGNAETGRVVVVAIGKEVATITVSSVTINNGAPNVAQTMTQAAAATFGNQGAWLYYLPLDGGTTADIVITWSGTGPTNVQNHISVYTIYNGRFPPRVASTNTSTDMDVSTPLTTGSQTINTNGGALACASCGTDTVAKTWANITADLDSDVGDFRWNTATRVTALAATAMTLTGTTNNEDGAMSYLIVDEATLPPPLNLPTMRPAPRG